MWLGLVVGFALVWSPIAWCVDVVGNSPVRSTHPRPLPSPVVKAAKAPVDPLKSTSRGDQFVKRDAGPRFASADQARRLKANYDRTAFLQHQGLGVDPRIKTIVVAVDMPNQETVLRSLTIALSDVPIQVVMLGPFARSPIQLSPNLRIARVKKDFAESLPDFLMAADVYVARGASPEAMQGYLIGVPMVTVGPQLFDEQGASVHSVSMVDVGGWVRRVATDPALREQQEAAQANFRARTGVMKASEAEQRLAQDFPSGFGILTDFGRFSAKNGGLPDPVSLFSQALGHNALYIDGKVYSISGIHQDKKKPGDALFAVHSVSQYLFPNVSHLNLRPFRTTLALSVQGVSAEDKAAMLGRIQQINADWNAGKIDFNFFKANCADYTLDVLQHGGLPVLPAQHMSTPQGLLKRVANALGPNARFKMNTLLYSSEEVNNITWHSLGSPLTAWVSSLPVNQKVERVSGAADLIQVAQPVHVTPMCRMVFQSMLGQTLASNK